MKTPFLSTPVRTRLLAAAVFLTVAIVVLTSVALAVPFHAPTIDGVITGNGTDWDLADRVVVDIADDDLAIPRNVRRLWLTWDQDNLYVGVTYQDIVDTAALSVFFDLDRGIGPNSAAVLDTAGGNFLLPTDHGFELVLRRSPTDGFPGLAPSAFLVTDDQGSSIEITDSITRAQRFNTGTKSNARFNFWLNAEFSLPWSVIYPDETGTVPPYAVIKAVAVATSAAANRNGYDSAPDNPGLDGGYEPVLLAHLHASVIDADGDGSPDPADATISGTVTLPDDAGTTTVTVVAELIDFAGREPGTPLSVVTTASGVRDWTLPRLSAGRYRVTTNATGYLASTVEVVVLQSQQVTGTDQTLEKATSISGAISFESGEGAAGTITLRDGTGTLLDSGSFTSAGGPYVLFVATGGDFDLSVSADTYMDASIPLTVTTGVDVTGLDIVLIRQTEISGSIAFAEGPGQAGTLEFLDQAETKLDDADFLASGGTFRFFTPEGGTFSLRASTELQNYAPFDTTFVVTAGVDATDLILSLLTVRATHLEIINASGVALPEIKATYYDPVEDPWTSGRVLLAARDDGGRDDIYDIDSRLSGLRLSARKMDDVSPTRGTPVFYRDATEASIDSTISFVNGRAEFWISNTAVEVLRVYQAQPSKAPIAGRIVVAFLDPQPTDVVLTASEHTFVADNIQTVTVSAQLYDSAGNLSLLPEIPISFSISNDSSGRGLFQVPTVLTNGTGLASAQLTATGSGQLKVTAAVTIDNRELAVESETLGSGSPFLILNTLPGATAGWRLSLPSNVSSLDQVVTVTGQLVDAFGNETAESGHNILFSADPAGMGSFNPASEVSDTDGRAVSLFTPAGNAGLVTLYCDGAGFTGDAAGLQLRNVMVIPDPVWYDEPSDHNTFDKTDLTALVVDNTPDELVLELPFQSDWGDLLLHIIFETNLDAAGAVLDPFRQPVHYGHANKPDYALVMKYSSNDYSDFSRWSTAGNSWEKWDLDNEVYVPRTSDVNADIHGPWISKEADRVVFRIPWAPFGGAPESMQLEAYLTQELPGPIKRAAIKRAAFDSAPQDATLDLDFDYNNPQPGDWESTLLPVTLVAWGESYVVKTEFPTPPTVENIVAEPADLLAGEMVTLRGQVTDAGDGVGDVLADLSAMGGSALARMYDDGNSSHGDVTAGDNIFSLRTLVPLSNPGGSQDLLVRAYDGSNTLATTGTVTIDVTAIVEPLVVALDAKGDDHGPNQADSARKYTTYPTNIAFVPGGFDLESLTVFETVAVVGGVQVEMIAFQVKIGDFPDPADPGTADWGPPYADLNIEKIDIMIDSTPGGATAGLPSRQAAFQPWDAWDYAIVIDGWYKGVIPSLGQNTLESWQNNALTADKDILLLSDPVQDTITALVSRTALGDPTAEDIQSWDLAVCMASHDGDQVLGGVRWVNEARGEWNFGGGQEGDRDSNIIDLLLVPGTGHSPGLSQEEILDYESPAALARLADRLTPVGIEMSQFEDTGPPVIDTGGKGSVVTRVAPLAEAPLALTIEITDDYRVERAEFRYRSTGFRGEGWERTVAMGYLGRDRWVVDIMPTFLDSLVTSPIDSTRYIEFEVWAIDPLDKTTTSPVTTLEISQPFQCVPENATLETENLGLLQVEGTALTVSDNLRGWFINHHIAEAWTGGAVSPDTMGSAVELQWDVCNVVEAIQNAPRVPQGAPVGIFREIFLATADTLGGYIDYRDKLDRPVTLSLHFPVAWLPAGTDKNTLAMYQYHPQSDRWVLIGGNISLTGNNVTAAVSGAGIYGLFRTAEVGFDAGEVLSGIVISPNPFSPNGDGLYDETNISFYLTQEATVTVEIYNIYGDRKQVLVKSFSLAGTDLNDATPRRMSGLIWDGTEFSGDVVPYGIYVLRVLATYNQAGGTRTIRSNHSLAVIK